MWPCGALVTGDRAPDPTGCQRHHTQDLSALARAVHPMLLERRRSGQACYYRSEQVYTHKAELQDLGARRAP